MKVYYDLHIHSILSPCADELMTPNNILNMCMLKKLNLISITDHNSLKQYLSIEKIKDSYDFLLIYGVEVTVLEGFHVLCYVEDYKKAMMLDAYIERHINQKKTNNLRQAITDEYDNLIDNIQYDLHQKINIKYDDLCKFTHKLGGIIILSHVERSYGILEYQDDFKNADGIESIKNLKYQGYKSLFSSDAHDLISINDNLNFINLEELNFTALKRWLNNE